MKEVEATGRTVEEAINRALAKLKVSRDEAEIDVVSEGSQGLFGLGNSEARVVARVDEQPFTAPTARASDAIAVTNQVIQDLIDLMDLDAGVEYLPDAMVTEETGNEREKPG